MVHARFGKSSIETVDRRGVGRMKSNAFRTNCRRGFRFFVALASAIAAAESLGCTSLLGDDFNVFGDAGSLPAPPPDGGPPEDAARPRPDASEGGSSGSSEPGQKECPGRPL